MNHVLPIDDEQEHELSPNCPCKPVLKQHTHTMVAIHNSFDCREYIEQAEKIEGIQPTVYDTPRWGVWRPE